MLPKNYKALSSFEKEPLLRGFFISIAISKQYLPATPEYDDGIDIVLIDRSKTPHRSYFTQLKSGLRIDHKYYGKGFWMGFIDAPSNTWYILTYDTLENLVLENFNVTKTNAWKNNKRHSSPKMSCDRRHLLLQYVFN